MARTFASIDVVGGARVATEIDAVSAIYEGTVAVTGDSKKRSFDDLKMSDRRRI